MKGLVLGTPKPSWQQSSRTASRCCEGTGRNCPGKFGSPQREVHRAATVAARDFYTLAVVLVSERLRRALDVLAGQALEEDVYVVGTRPTTVRARPGSGLVLGTAYTNQQVLVTGKSSRWLKVRFRDHLEQRDIEGWVLKHYLQPLKERAGP